MKFYIPQSFKFNQVKGDLFSCPETDSLAHCISEDCRMGKGIAVLFKRKFGRVDEIKAQGLWLLKVNIHILSLNILIQLKS